MTPKNISARYSKGGIGIMAWNCTLLLLLFYTTISSVLVYIGHGSRGGFPDRKAHSAFFTQTPQVSGIPWP